jgi:hypothetical protein
MTPPQTNVVVRELGRLGFRLGLLEGGTPDWIALAQARGVSPAFLFAVMAQGSEVGKEILYPLRDRILAVTRGLDPHYYNMRRARANTSSLSTGTSTPARGCSCPNNHSPSSAHRCRMLR